MLSCQICEAETPHELNGMPLCFDCICDMQEGSSDRIKEAVEKFRENHDDDDIDAISMRVCNVVKIEVVKLQENTRKREIVEARQLCMFFAKKNNCGSLAHIGSKLGSKDHATVLHAIKTVNNLRDTNFKFRNKYVELFEYYS